MNAIEQDFEELLLDEGALKRLSRAADKVRSILLQARLGKNKVKRLGHCGIMGEFMHSLYFAMPIFGDETTQQGIDTLFEVWKKPSQLSASAPEIARECFQNETYGAAIPRAIQDLKDFANTSRSLPDNKKIELKRLATECEEHFAPIKAFVDKHAPKL